ncbi:hypothetical protein ONZ43_g271 [Nemania bipapillata]|uniref:Uncharacterized protein n=1 Tax=Nemania bipapillata TaxID=110536 RepID=A0ACC2J9M2_9PEZI|nr:hypothetical protein ONZ43_g271 [Nemania bipapillata]
MAGPGGKYFIQEKMAQPAEHHASFEALWKTKWKPLCDKGIYPFMFGTTADFEPIAEKMIAAGLKPPYDWDEYASYFLAAAHRLTVEAAASINKEKASELFMYVEYSPRSP